MIRHKIDRSSRLNGCVKRFITRSVIPFTAIERLDAQGRGRIICSDKPIDALLNYLSQNDIYADEGVELSFVGEYKEKDGKMEFDCIYLEAEDGKKVIRLGVSKAGDFQPKQLTDMNIALGNLPLNPLS